MRNFNILFCHFIFVFIFYGTVNANLYSNIVAHYTFNNTLYDESGNGNDGIEYGATLSKDRFGNDYSAYSFDGINNYVEVPNSASLQFNMGDSIAISLWICPLTSNSNSVFLQKGGIDNNEANYVLRQNGMQVDFFYWAANNSWQGVRTGNVLAINKWNHIAVSFKFGSPETLRIHVNCVQRNYNWAWGNGKIGPHESIQSLRFGGINYWGQKYKGLIDEVLIFNRFLSELEIRQLFTANENLQLKYLDHASINDLNGNNLPEIATLAFSRKSNTIVFIKDSKTNLIINEIQFFNDNNWEPVSMSIVPDINNNNAPEISVLGTKKTTGTVWVQIKDSHTGEWLNNLSFPTQ